MVPAEQWLLDVAYIYQASSVLSPAGLLSILGLISPEGPVINIACVHVLKGIACLTLLIPRTSQGVL